MYDNIFRALAHEQRRTLLVDVLREHPQDVVVEAPARERAVTDAERREKLVMYHSHLPKLEAYGFIEWNKDTHEVGKGPRFENIRPLLECVDPRENSRPERTTQTMNSSETDTGLLTTAVEQGFFKVPRETPLVDIADTHDISDVEAFERLQAELDMALREYLDEFDATATGEE